MKPWQEFSLEDPELASLGQHMLFQKKHCVGLAFLATIRKDGAPRLHPVSLVLSQDGLYVFIPTHSPKYADLRRDGRYALQAFPPPKNVEGKEFYLSGAAKLIRDPLIRQAIITKTGIDVAKNEALFELFMDRAMFTMLVDQGAPYERPWHRIWHKPVSRQALDNTH
jgi:hypothetical protein